MSSSTQLAILGLLNEGEKHGYQIYREIEQRMSDYTNVKLGSVYHALGKFNDKGLVEVSSIEKKPGNPERQVYKITNSGQEHFQKLLRKELGQYGQYSNPIGVVLNFLYCFSVDELVPLLQKRLDRYKKCEKELMAERVAYLSRPELPRFIDLAFDNGTKHLRTEIQWLEESIFRLKTDPNLLDISAIKNFNKKQV